MQWFKDRRTATKLFLSFGFLALLMGGVGYLGIRGMARIQDLLRDLHQNHALGVMYLEQANTHLTATGRSVRRMQVATDAVQIRESEQDLLAHRQQFDNNFEQFRKTLQTDAGRAKAAEAEKVWREMCAKQDDFLSLMRQNQRQQALADLPVLVSAAAQADQVVGELSKMKQALMDRAIESAESAFQSTRDTLVAIVLGSIAAAVGLGFFIAHLISRPLAEAVSALESVGDGDFTKSLEVSSADEVGQMAKALNRAVGNMRDALLEVSESSGNVSEAAQQLATASEEVASGAQEQASSLEETASSLEEISSTIKQNAENAKQASQLAAGSREAAEKGGQVVNAAVEAMGQINEASKHISDIITTIDEIAFQTNLLALNAAVEAARAGEQGRGFAVVASEVRNLAQRSAAAAKEIKGLIQDSVRKVGNGSELVNRSGQTLGEIMQSVKRVTDIVAEIAAASAEQASGIEQVNKAAMQMDQVTQANSAQTEEMSSTAQGLSSNAEQLQALVARFHLGNDAVKAPPVRHAGKRQNKPAPPRMLREKNEPALAALAQKVGVQGKEDFEEF
ncbi:MAG: methyl-accepting chemotaxis protein [Bryobacteraceae bacterium]|jgi:methyl-accepting chemotaxis protein